MNWIADTNVISELTRPTPNPRVLAWVRRVGRIAVSVISIEEVYSGLSWKPRPMILAWFQKYFANEVDVLPITADIARRSGELRGFSRSQGRALTNADMLIAATAQMHGLTLVTRDSADFEACGISTFNPFS